MTNQEDKSLQRATLIVASVASFITPFIGSSINIALPAIGKAFSANAIMLSWVATSFLLSSAIFLVPFGRIADIHGRKKIFNRAFLSIHFLLLPVLLLPISPH